MVDKKEKKASIKAKNVDGIMAKVEKGSMLDKAFQERMAGDPTLWNLYKKNWSEYMGDYRAMEDWYRDEVR